MTFIALIVPIITFSMALNFFAIGLGATFADATHLFRRPEKLVRAFLSMYVAMPLVAVALALMFDLGPATKFALVALSVTPVPPTNPRSALKAGGQQNYSVGLLVTASLLAIVLVPLAMKVFGIVFNRPLHMSAQSPAAVLVPYLLAPLAAGMVVRAIVPAVAARMYGPVGILAQALFTVGLLTLLISAREVVLSLWSVGTIAAFAAFGLAGLLAGHLLGGPKPEDRTVLAVYTAARHPGVAVAIAQVNFPEQQGLAAIACIVAVLVAMIVTVPYLQWTKRHALRAAILRS